jgi:integrase
MSKFVTMEQNKTPKKTRKPAQKKKTERFKVEEIIGMRGSSWLVTGYKFDGTRVRQKFKTKVKADSEVHALSLQVADGGLRTIATKLTEEQIEDSQAAFRLLDEGDTLLGAVQFYKDNYKRTSGLALDEAIFKFIESKEKAKKSERTTRQLKSTCKRFAESVSNKAVDEVLRGDIDAYLKQYNAQSFNNIRTELLGFFKWCIKENLCAENPVEGIERVKVYRDPEFLKPKEVESLLLSGMENSSGDLLAFLSIAFFAGLRPDSELKKMTWDMVNFVDNEIQVPAGKTGVKRTVKMKPNLVELLAECDRSKPIYPANFRRKFSVVKRGAGFKGGITNTPKEAKLEAKIKRKWPQDVSRHSFITYYVRDCGDVFKTATTAGNSPDIIKEHYEGAATSTQAKAFWAITPKSLLESKVVKFAV